MKEQKGKDVSSEEPRLTVVKAVNLCWFREGVPCLIINGWELWERVGGALWRRGGVF